ncbi:hypothetical protein D5086_014520 [Populus alba]|uniref:Uncharacterized protein n=1 Tax=Populus alba TaxID=43335 RepID=A0ACC4BY82_POPAL
MDRGAKEKRSVEGGGEGLKERRASSKDIKGPSSPPRFSSLLSLDAIRRLQNLSLSFFLTHASLLGIIFFVEPCAEELTFKACESYEAWLAFLSTISNFMVSSI